MEKLRFRNGVAHSVVKDKRLGVRFMEKEKKMHVPAVRLSGVSPP